ncbi:MAG: ComEA family DNA-binding protein [Atribacterota bacterium]
MISLSRRERIIALCASLCAFLFIGVVWWLQRPKVEAPPPLVVHIEGAVQHPGVYEVPQGTRLFELIARAGGAKEDADLRGLNLAAPLYDGQKVTIPALLPQEEKGEGSSAASLAAQRSAAPLVNVNTASQKELESLPGIGEVLAQRIIEYRETHGPFQTPEDLLKVRGIGPKKLEKLRDRITF